MNAIAGFKRTGRKLHGPGADLEEMEDARGFRHTAIVFHPEYREHQAINSALTVVLGFLESPMVTGIVELVAHDQQQGAFVYPTGRGWSVAEVIRTCADLGEPAGVRAGLELMFAAGEVLSEAAETGEPHGVYSHGGLTPWRMILKPDGQLQIIGYALPQVEILQFHDDPQAIPREDSFRYCPPERLDGKPEDLSSDLFAVALVAFELMTGKPVYDGLVNDIRAMASRAEGSRRLFRFRDQLPNIVQEVLKTALRRDQPGRYSDGRSLMEAVSQAMGNPEVSGPSLMDVMTRVGSVEKRVGTPLEGGATMMASRDDLARMVAAMENDTPQRDPVARTAPARPVAAPVAAGRPGVPATPVGSRTPVEPSGASLRDRRPAHAATAAEPAPPIVAPVDAAQALGQSADKWKKVTRERRSASRLGGKGDGNEASSSPVHSGESAPQVGAERYPSSQGAEANVPSSRPGADLVKSIVGTGPRVRRAPRRVSRVFPASEDELAGSDGQVLSPADPLLARGAPVAMAGDATLSAPPDPLPPPPTLPPRDDSSLLVSGSVDRRARLGVTPPPPPPPPPPIGRSVRPGVPVEPVKEPALPPVAGRGLRPGGENMVRVQPAPIPPTVAHASEPPPVPQVGATPPPLAPPPLPEEVSPPPERLVTPKPSVEEQPQVSPAAALRPVAPARYEALSGAVPAKEAPRPEPVPQSMGAGRVMRAPDPLPSDMVKGESTLFRIQSNPDSRPVRFRMPVGAPASEAVVRLLGTFVPLRCDLAGRITGWYRLVVAGQPVDGQTLMSSIDPAQVLEVVFVENKTVWFDIVVEQEGGIKLRAPVATAVPACALVDHIATMLDLPGGDWRIRVGERLLYPHEILDDLLSSGVQQVEVVRA